MKKRWVVNLSMVAMMVMFWALPAKAAKIADFLVSDSFITVGESFDVAVSVYDDGTFGDLVGFGFDVDPSGTLSFLFFDGYVMGTNFDDVSDSLNPKNVSGLYFDSLLAPQPSNMWLATLSFTALGVGTDMLTIEGIFDGFNGLVYLFAAEDINGSKGITVQNPVPEPASILLLGAGIVGLGIWKRKKRG